MKTHHERSSRLWAPMLVAACIVASTSGCATNPVTGQSQLALMSEAQEIETGRQMDVDVRRQMGVYEDARLQRYVEEIGLSLARQSHRPNLPWTFAIVDSPVVNAFALPGGYIYVTRGLLAHMSDEAELAGVLGHEVGHVTARHAVESYSRGAGAQLGLAVASILFPSARPYGELASTGLGLLFLKYGRDDELQADGLGVEYAGKSGWDPRGVADMLQTLARLDAGSTDRKGTPNWLATHPDPLSRVQKVQSAVAAQHTAAAERSPGRRDRAEYLERVAGLPVGENPREGVVRGNAFLHPDLRFELEFPERWQVSNSPEQVVARPSGGDAFMFLDLVREARGGSLDQVAQQNMGAVGFRAVDGQRVSLDGMDAFVGTFEGDLQGRGRVAVRAAFIGSGANVYRLAGVAPPDRFGALSREFDASIRSFRRLSAREAESIRPNRLALYTVRPGDTWRGIAEGPSRGNARPTQLAIMNGFDQGEPPQPGDRIKIVVDG